MSTRKPRKTVGGGATNPALTPNRDGLKVGDETSSRPGPPKPERKPFGSYLAPDIQREFKAACVLQGIEMQDALEQAIRSWLAENSAS